MEKVREYRGTINRPGKESPWRNRTVEENLDLFDRMRKGEFPDGSKTLRAKIDMADPNLLLRDPLMYRIRRATHYRTGEAWCIYPTYDWAHGQCDSLEGVTHSICTLEFEVHRPLYDWFLDRLGIHHPQQIEFARLNISHTVLSKRRLLELVEKGFVSGWDDPRMPTISGFRRRGYTPASIRAFCDLIGVSKANSIVDAGVLENCLREELNKTAPRVMAVIRPLKVVLTNYPEGKVEEFEAVNNPEDPAGGTRKVPFSRELYIEREDFMEDPPKKFFRLAPGREVRLRYAYFIKCEEVVKDPATGEITELRCTYDPATPGRGLPGRPQGQGDPPLGLGGPGRRGRGQAVRNALHRPRSQRRPRGRRLQDEPEPEVPRGPQGMPGRASTEGRGTREPVAIRAPGLLHGGFPGFEAGRARLQPHGDPPRRVGEAHPDRKDRRVGSRPTSGVHGRRPEQDILSRIITDPRPEKGQGIVSPIYLSAMVKAAT